MRNFQFVAPDEDFELVINFSSGKKVTVKASEGNLSITLPDNQPVTNYFGDNKRPSTSLPGEPETRIAKELVTKLP